MKVGFLGPKGTFTEKACICYDKDAERIAYNTFFDALLGVEEGECDRCLAAVENSTEGTVNTTLDPMIFDRNLFIEKLIILPIEQNILIKKGADPSKIRKIVSHPQALAQCRIFTREHFKDACEVTVSSTAEAAKITAESDGHIAAVASSLTAELYGLDILYKSVQDNNTNRTSFVAVTKEDTSAPKKGCITTIAFSTRNEPGELYRILDIYSLWDINMTKILSRPWRNKPGEYIFITDIENNNIDDVKDALVMIRRKTKFFKILGTYPIEDYSKKL